MTEPIELTTIHQYIAIAEMCPPRAAYVVSIADGPKCLFEHELFSTHDTYPFCRELLFKGLCPLGYFVKAPEKVVMP